MAQQDPQVQGLASPLLQASGPGKGSDGATIAQLSFNLVKNLVGSGVLALPYGVAKLESANSLPFTCFVLSFMALLCGYCFALLGQLCAASRSESYGHCWSATFGAKTAWIPRLFLFVKLFSGCLAYSMILADAFTDIFRSYGAPAGVNRSLSLWVITITCLLPLCLQRSLKALAPFSLLGTFCMVYISLFMGWRWYDRSYQPGGEYYEPMRALAHASSSSGIVEVLRGMTLVSICSTAFMAHYNAPKFYWELVDRSQARYCVVVTLAFLAALILSLLITCFGFLTFGPRSDGLVLNNYSTKDPLATLARTSLSFALLFGYPLMFQTLVDVLLDVLGQVGRTQRGRDAYSVAVLFAVTVLAMFIRDLGFLLAFVGALLGAAIIYIIPSAMALGSGVKAPCTGLNTTVLVLGVALMVCGGVVTVLTKLNRI